MEEDWLRERERSTREAQAKFDSEWPERLEAIGVSPIVLEALKRPNSTPATQGAQRFADSGKSILVLAGGPGAGKTVGACSLLRALTPARAKFIRAVDALAISTFGEENADRWDRLGEVRWLVLDDLGMEHGNDYSVARLDALLDKRHGNPQWLRTAITTNLTVAQLRDRYGPRVADRIIQVGMVVNCGGKSLRRPA